MFVLFFLLYNDNLRWNLTEIVTFKVYFLMKFGIVQAQVSTLVPP